MLIRNACFLLGLVSLASGCWLWSPALALVVVGVVLISLSIWGTINATG